MALPEPHKPKKGLLPAPPDPGPRPYEPMGLWALGLDTRALGPGLWAHSWIPLYGCPPMGPLGGAGSPLYVYLSGVGLCEITSGACASA